MFWRTMCNCRTRYWWLSKAREGVQKETESVGILSMLPCSGIYKETKVMGSGLTFSLQVGRGELSLHVGCVGASQQQEWWASKTSTLIFRSRVLLVSRLVCSRKFCRLLEHFTFDFILFFVCMCGEKRGRMTPLANARALGRKTNMPTKPTFA